MTLDMLDLFRNFDFMTNMNTVSRKRICIMCFDFYRFFDCYFLSSSANTTTLIDLSAVKTWRVGLLQTTGERSSTRRSWPAWRWTVSSTKACCLHNLQTSSVPESDIASTIAFDINSNPLIGHINAISSGPFYSSIMIGSLTLGYYICYGEEGLSG